MSVQIAVMSSIKPEQNTLLSTTITSLKYKFVLHLLKGDGRNRLVSVYNKIIKFFNTYYYIPIISKQTELEAEGRAAEQFLPDGVS